MSPFNYTSTEGLSLLLSPKLAVFCTSLISLISHTIFMSALTSPAKQWNVLFSQKVNFGAISLGSIETLHLMLCSWQVERCDYWKPVVHLTMLALNTAFDTLKHNPPTTWDIWLLPVPRKFCTHLLKQAFVLCCAGDSSAPEPTAIASCFHSSCSFIILTVILTLMILTTSLIQINMTLLHLFFTVSSIEVSSCLKRNIPKYNSCTSISSFKLFLLFITIDSYDHYHVHFPIPFRHFYRCIHYFKTILNADLHVYDVASLSLF